MGKRLLVLLWLIATGLSGCRQGGPYMSAHLELMNAEKRALEDELYSLEFDYEDAIREIKKLKQDNERLRGLSGTSPRPSGETRSSPSAPAKNSTSPDTDLTPPMVDEGMLVEPKIEIPDTSPKQSLPPPRPSNTLPPAKSPTVPAPPASSLHQPHPAKLPVSVEAPTRLLTLEPGDPRVTQIFLNPVLTSGADFDHQPGDDGVLVVVEPRNRDNAFVPLAGPISVILLDPARTTEQGRIVARWDIDANEAQQSLLNSTTVRGIRLRLPWPSERPQAGRLHLYVRYLTVDNRDLRADREVFITLPGQTSFQRWTPRAKTNSPTAPTMVSTSPSEEGTRGAISDAASPARAEGAVQSDDPNPVQGLPPPSETLAAEPATPSTGASSQPPTDTPSASPTQTARPEWRPYR